MERNDGSPIESTPGHAGDPDASGTFASATTNGRMSDVTTNVVEKMEAAAEWLRDADLDGLKAGIEKQVKEHPGRTLLIAVGIGYLVGRAFRE